MKRIVWIGVALVAGANLIACGAPDASTKSTAAADRPAKTETAASSLVVTGRVASNVALVKARAVAVATDGTMVWTHLDKDGDFKLVLPVGQSYRVLIANERTTGKGQEVIGQLMLDMNKGRTQWIGAKQAGTVDLGTLKPAGVAGAKTGGITIKTADMDADDDDADDDDDDDMDHSDDNECHTSGGGGGKAGTYPADGAAPTAGDGDDDDDDDADLCTAGATTELQPSKTPSAEYCDDDDDHDDDADSDDGKTCH